MLREAYGYLWFLFWGAKLGSNSVVLCLHLRQLKKIMKFVFFIFSSTEPTLPCAGLPALDKSTHYCRWRSPPVRGQESRWFAWRKNRTHREKSVRQWKGRLGKNWNYCVSPNRDRSICGSFHRAWGVYRRWSPRCRDSDSCETVRVQSIRGFRHNGVRLLHRSNLLPHVWLCKRNPAQASFMVQLIGVWVGAGGSAFYDRRVCFRVSARTGQRQPFFHCFRIRGIFSCSACLLPRHLDSHAPWAGEDGMAASRVERSC